MTVRRSAPLRYAVVTPSSSYEREAARLLVGIYAHDQFVAHAAVLALAQRVHRLLVHEHLRDDRSGTREERQREQAVQAQRDAAAAMRRCC